jgi:ketosteroid isomerase-like protein
VTISSTLRSNKRPCTLQQAAEHAKEVHGLDEVTDEVVECKPAIRDFWQGVMDMGVDQAQLDIVEVEHHRHT